MELDLSEELEGLKRLSTNELCERYAALYGQPVRTRHKAYLVRKVAWRIQALAEGDLSERARRRAAELANDADVRLMPPRPKTTPPPPEAAGGRRVVRAPVKADPRLPAPGTALVRRYKGQTYRVVVRDDGLEYAGTRYKTLTAVAEAITGQHLNGYRFFRLEGSI
jgi:hypothetical protein